MRCLTLLILIMTDLMDLFRRRPVWAGASAPPGTGPASARAPKLRCAASRLASRPGGQGARRSRASGLPPGTPGSRPDGGSLPQRSAPADPSAPTAGAGPRERFRNITVRTRRGAPYHHSARPGGPAPIALCTATRNACSAIQNRAERLLSVKGHRFQLRISASSRRSGCSRLLAAAGEPLAGEVDVGGVGGWVVGDPHASTLPCWSRTSCRQTWSDSRRLRQRIASLGVLPSVRLRSRERRPSVPGTSAAIWPAMYLSRASRARMSARWS